MLAIAQSQTWGFADPATAACVVGAAALLWFFVRRSRNHPTPLFDLDLLKLRSYAVAQFGTLFFCAPFFGWFVVLPAFLLDWWQWSVLSAGLALMPGPALAVLISPLAGPRLLRRASVGVRLLVSRKP